VDVDIIGRVGVGFGGTYACRCGVLYAPMLRAVFYAGLVIYIGILYKTLLARKLSKPEDGRYRPEHVVFPC